MPRHKTWSLRVIEPFEVVDPMGKGDAEGCTSEVRPGQAVFEKKRHRPAFDRAMRLPRVKSTRREGYL